MLKISHLTNVPSLPHLIQQIRLVSSQQLSPSAHWSWTKHMLKMPVSYDRQIQVEFGVCLPKHPDGTTASSTDLDTPSSILAIHPSGSSYRQFSQLPSYLPTNSCPRVVGLNLWGSGQTEPWPRDLRVQTLADQAESVEKITEAAMGGQTGGSSDTRWHLIGHSFGGWVAVSAVGLATQFSLKVSELTLYEPNVFYLLSVGNDVERNILDEYKRRFYQTFYKCWDSSAGKLSEDEIIEYASRDFYQFWFSDDWDKLTPDKRPKMFEHGITSTHYNEIHTMKEAYENAPLMAAEILQNLARVKHKKMIMSKIPGPGSRNVMEALASLLKREADFQIIRAPVGDHLAPITHKKEIFPLFFN